MLCVPSACRLTPQSRNTIRPSIRAKNRWAMLPLAKAAKPCSRCRTTRYSKVNPEAPFIQQSLFDQCLIVCICKVETNNLELLFTNFVINTKAVWEKILHCTSQVTRAATKFNAIKTSLPQPGRLGISNGAFAAMSLTSGCRGLFLEFCDTVSAKCRCHLCSV